MNDRRFIELLNLYVDQELTDQEAHELEQEIARNAARRQVYGQYCRMQRACVKLFDQQAAPAPRVAAIKRAVAETEGERELVFRPAHIEDPVVERRARAWWGWGSGALAAAAAVALVFVQVNKPAALSEPVGTGSLATVEAPAQPAAAPESVRSDYRPVFVVNLRPTAAQLAQRESALALDQPTFDLDQELRLRPLRRVPLESLQFTPRSFADPAFVNDTHEGPAAEMVTFTFQR